MKTSNLSTEITIQVLKSLGVVPNVMNAFLISDYYLVSNIKIDSDGDQNSYAVYGASINNENIKVIATLIDNSWYCVWLSGDAILGAVLTVDSTTDGTIFNNEDGKWKEVSDRSKANILIGSYMLLDNIPVWLKLGKNYDRIFPFLQSLIEMVVE